MDQLSLAGRAAIVTGAASGIGRALALEAVSRGMSVALADIDEEGLARVAAEIAAAGGESIRHRVDVRSEEEVEAFAAACFAHFPSIAAVFANAGIIRYGSTLRPNLQEWRQVVDINLMGAIHSVAGFVGRLMDRAEPAQFVLTASQASFVVAPELAAYAAAKHGVWALADILRLELEREDTPVRASMIAPGTVHTNLSTTSIGRVRARAGEAASEAYVARMMQPADVAKTCLDAVVARQYMIVVGNEYRDMMIDRLKDIV